MLILYVEVVAQSNLLSLVGGNNSDLHLKKKCYLM